MSQPVRPRQVLIVGASVRAAAWSMARANWEPFAIDLFGDRDLRALATTRRVPVHDYPHGLLDQARAFPELPIVYTGALENDPDLVGRLADGRRLLGNSAEVLRAVRDPIRLARFWHDAGISAPSVTLDPSAIPRNGSWLAKPIRSAGGRGIRRFLGEGPTDGHYFQKRIDGTAGSACFAADGPGRLRFLGVTRQWLDGFRYVGSVGPWRVEDRLARQIARIGSSLAAEFRLQGPFGVDFIERDGIPWPVEVNPRYTASVEVLELATGRSAFSAEIDHPVPARSVGKRIVLADRAGPFPRSFPAEASRDDLWAVPEAADLPDPGEPFEPGQPVLTVLAEGDSIEAVTRTLQDRHDDWLGRLDESNRPPTVRGRLA